MKTVAIFILCFLTIGNFKADKGLKGHIAHLEKLVINSQILPASVKVAINYYFRSTGTYNHFLPKRINWNCLLFTVYKCESLSKGCFVSSLGELHFHFHMISPWIRQWSFIIDNTLKACTFGHGSMVLKMHHNTRLPVYTYIPDSDLHDCIMSVNRHTSVHQHYMQWVS